MGRFVLWSKVSNMKMRLNLDLYLPALKNFLTVVSDCFHVSGSLRSSFSKNFFFFTVRN